MPKTASATAHRVLRDDPLYTREEAAQYLNVTLRFVTRCVQERRISYVRVGRMVRIPESAIRDYLDQHSVAPRAR